MASVTVDVEIDEFDDAEIICAAKDRGYRVLVSTEQMKKFDRWDADQIRKCEIDEYEERIASDDLCELRRYLLNRQYADALALVDALMFPKFKTLSECEDKYKVALTTR